MGIKRQDKKKLFKLFGFVQTTQEVNTRGIGLGLVISKKIVEMYEGNIGFKSKWRSGSTFAYNVSIELSEDLEKAQIAGTLSNLDHATERAPAAVNPDPEVLDTECQEYENGEGNPEDEDTEQDLDMLINGHPILPNNVISHLP